MVNKWIKTLAAALCVVMAVPVIGSAAPLEKDKKCSLKVEAIKSTENNSAMAADLWDNANLVYDLYKVGEIVDDGGYYTYKLTDEFAKLRDNEKLENFVDEKGQLIVPRDTPDGGTIDSSLWDDLSQEAARLALDIQKENGEKPGAGDNAGGGDTAQAGGLPVIGEIVGTDKPGEGRFTPVLTGVRLGVEQSDLNTGLYLLIARGSNIESYITKEYPAVSSGTEPGGNDPVPGGETKEEKIVTVAYTDQHVYTFAPELISLPAKEPDADGIISTAGSGDWIYGSTVYLKPEQHTRYGYLEIVKDLLTYESFAGQSEEATFVFQVEAVLNGQSVYSDVKTLVFTGAGKDSVVIDKIPVGAAVTVTEVYSGASYTLKEISQGYYAQDVSPDGGNSAAYAPAGNVSTREVTGFAIEANRVASVKFTNDYDHRQAGGHGVINRYEYGEDGWAAEGAQQQWTNPAQNHPPQGNENP